MVELQRLQVGSPHGIPSGMQGPGSVRVANTAHDSHSVDREEVNTPSSDTETVGGVSEAIRGLDALDISAIFSRRASVMRSPPKFLSGAFRSVMRVALHEIVTGAERHDELLSARGGNCSCCCRVLLFRPLQGGKNFQTAASGTVQRFLPRGVGVGVDAIR